MNLQNKKKIESMKIGGEKLGKILHILLSKCTTGISLLNIEKEAQKMIKKAGGTPSFMTVQGYKWATCICINDEVVHGIPTDYQLQEGDVLTIDIGMVYQGYHTDTAYTVIIGSENNSMNATQAFLEVGKKALQEAIQQAKVGNQVGHISKIIQEEVESGGYSIISSLVGHGIGKQLHQSPQIPGVLVKDLKKTPILEEGMTIAIEVIYAMGKDEIIHKNEDGWTLSTKDGSLTAVFEHTVAILFDGPCVLTKV
ncbi:type I methionyl aminopeptidase [Patescibacteria group bacterium]